MLVRNASAAGSLDEAEPDAGDFAILGQDNSGVVSGGAVTASSPESMTVHLAAARVVINGTPYSFDAQSVALEPSSGAASRFDLVGWTASGPTFITGTASANPEFPAFNVNEFVVGAAVYVGQSVTEILQERITEKLHHVLASFKRSYPGENEVVIETSSPTRTANFQLLSNGRLKWVDSVLRRTAEQTMEWLTSLTIKQGVKDAAALVLKIASGSTGADTVFKVEHPTTTEALASINGAGQFTAANIKRGTGAPNGVVAGTTGDEYTDITATNPNLMKWVKTTPSGTSGWVSFRQYVANESALPTGTLIPWVGLTTDPIPAGFSLCTGGTLAVNASTQDLADLIGTRFGTAPEGFVRLPDLRNRVVGGASTAAISGVGTLSVGTVLGTNTRTLSIANIPSHNHSVTDPGHVHPQQGPRWYYKPGVWGWPAYRPGGTGSPHEPGQWVEDQGFDRRAKTGISLQPAGSGTAFPVMQETIGMNWLVKW